MIPAGPLMIEHRLIERMIAVMDRHRVQIDAGQAPDVALLDTFTDFLRYYADKCHHGKEEDLLFKVLATKDLPMDMRAAMDRLIADHRLSRQATAQLEALTASLRGGDRSAIAPISSLLAGLVKLYPDHIHREDRLFFPQAMQYLDPQERDEMVRAFQEFDRKLIHEKYGQVVQGAERR